MRIRILRIVTALLWATGAAAQEPADQALFQRAISLHDSGDYNGAIALYKELLKTSPGNDTVRYELAYSTMAKGDSAETIRLATEGVRRPGPTQVRFFELLGNAYDAEDRTKDAIEAYKRGIKVDPKYAPIRFNLGVAYGGQQKLKEAREAFEDAIEIEPSYASPHFFIGAVYRADGYRIPAILAYGRLLSLERTTQRAALAAKTLHELMNAGITGTGPENLQLLISPSKTELGDFSSLELMLSIVVAGNQLKDKTPKPESERAAEAFGMFMSMLAEKSGDYKRGFVAKTYVPFYADLVKAGHSTPFAYVALAPLKLAGADEWLSSHKTEVTALEQWLRAYGVK